MNRDQVEGNWKQVKGRARQKWGKLTDDQLDRSKGRREELVGQVQETYGRSREEAQKEVDTWMAGLDQSGDSPEGTRSSSEKKRH